MSGSGPNSTPASAAAVNATRWPLLDVMRWPAIYAIVWLHTVPWNALTRFAVPFFVAACVFLVFQGVRRKPQRAFVEYGWNRFVRIYVPFLAWSAVYLGFKAIKSRFLPNQPNDFPGIEVLWLGSFYHLWFMPFILLVSLVAFLVAKIVNGRERLQWPVAIAALVAGVALSIWISPGATNAGPLDYMADALPAMFWAMTIGLVYSRAERRLPAIMHRGYLDVLLFVGSMAWLAVFGRSGPAENMAGASLLLISLRPTDSATLSRAARLPPLAYGIYLSHMLPIKICEALAARSGLELTWQLDCGIFLVSAVSATLIAWLLYQSRWTRWLAA
jgi:surface polysaccharide O-acyltransferase-like enzyme